MPFDPDAYLQETKPSFDPDAFLSGRDPVTKKINEPREVPFSKAYLTGLTDPWSDEALATYRSMKKGTSYDDEIEQARSDVSKYQSAKVPYYAGLGSQIIATLPAGASFSGLRAARYGIPAAHGALSAIGASEDKTSPETMKAAAISAGLGLGLAGAGDVISNLPTLAGKGVKLIGSPKPDELKYLKEFEEKPGVYMKRFHETEGAPREALIKETREGIALENQRRAEKLAEFEKGKERALSEYKHEEILAQTNINNLKSDERLSKQLLDSERKDYQDMMRNRAATTAEEGDLVVDAVKGMQNKYGEIAKVRNEVLHQSGQAYNVNDFKPFFTDAYNSLALESDKEIIQGVWNRFRANANKQGFVTPDQVNQFRSFLQKNVSYGKFSHLPKHEARFSDISRNLNDYLDARIPENNELRASIRQSTIDFNKAMDLFGGEYPIAKFKSSLKDPMKRRDIENLGVPELDDFIKKTDYQNRLEKSFKDKTHQYPQFEAEKDIEKINERVTNAQKHAEDIKKSIIAKKQSEMEFEKLPFTEATAESNIQQYMYASPSNPRLQAKENLMTYASKYAPDEADYLNKLEQTRVLEATNRVRTPAGSKFVNMMKSIGKPLGPIGEGVGAFVGGAYEQSFPTMYRQAITYGARPNIVKDVGTFISNRAAPFAAHQYAKEQVAGTKYESTFTGDPKSDGINHFILMGRDPEYAQLYMGNQ